MKFSLILCSLLTTYSIHLSDSNPTKSLVKRQNPTNNNTNSIPPQTVVKSLFEYWYKNVYSVKSSPNMNTNPPSSNTNANVKIGFQNDSNNNENNSDNNENDSDKNENDSNNTENDQSNHCKRIVSPDEACELASVKTRESFYTEVNRTKPKEEQGQCTEWVDGRYFSLFGEHILFNGSAHTFEDQAKEAGEYVIDDFPIIGSVMVIPSNTLGSSDDGHVGIVEKIYSNGEVCTSNWNAPDPGRLTMKRFSIQPNVIKFFYHKQLPELECS